MSQLMIELASSDYITGWVSTSDEHELLFGEPSGEKWIDVDGGTALGGWRIRVASIVRVKLPSDREDPVAAVH